MKLLESSSMKVIDYALGAGCIVYGLFTQDWLFVAGGGLGLALSYAQVAQKVSAKIQEKFKPAAPVDHSLAIIQEKEMQQAIADAVAELPPDVRARQALIESKAPERYSVPMLNYSTVSANLYKHNLLHRNSSNLYSKGVPFC